MEEAAEKEDAQAGDLEGISGAGETQAPGVPRQINLDSVSLFPYSDG